MKQTQQQAHDSTTDVIPQEAIIEQYRKRMEGLVYDAVVSSIHVSQLKARIAELEAELGKKK